MPRPPRPPPPPNPGGASPPAGTSPPVAAAAVCAPPRPPRPPPPPPRPPRPPPAAASAPAFCPLADAAAASKAAIFFGVMVQLSRLPRSIEFIPIRHMLNRNVSRYRDATSQTARLLLISYSMDCR